MSLFSKDFLAEYNTTQINDKVLRTLHAFLNGAAEETGWLFEREIKACKLDYTLASLKRIDAMLDRIRESQTLDRETFLANRKPENSHFLVLLAFYCGEMRGRLAGVAPIWQTYESHIAENPEMAHIMPPVPEYRFVATYHRANDIYQHFPLVAIFERLFPEHDEPEKSVYFSTITGNHANFAPDEVVPPAFQSLPFDLQAACQNLSAHWQSYLQILPPKWLFGDELMSQIKAVPTLYQKGRVVWGALVQANTMLFEENNPASCPAEIIYDKSGRTPPHLLHELAQTLLSFKKQIPDDIPPKLKQYAQHLQNERTRFSSELPAPPTTVMSLYAKTIFVWRPHLPDAMLTLPIFPIIINDDNDEAMILPAKFWAHTEYYQKWIANPKDFIQEIVPMWAHLPSEKASRFWENYEELLTPQSDVLAKLFNPNAPPHNPNDFRQPEPPETGKPSFLIRLRNAAQKDYPRWMEIYDLNEFPDPETRASLAKDRLPPSLYQALKKWDLSPFLPDLEETFQAANLPKTKPLPKVLAALKQPQLSPTQTASLVQFLLQQGDVSLSKLLESEGKTTQYPHNTTALLYLAILYLTGKHVPQTIEEGLFWLNYAAKLGDGRALRWQTKLALDYPSLVPILFKDFLRKEMVNFNLVLTNEGCSPLAINEAVKAYAQNPQAQKWLARRPLQTAYEQGDKIAEQLLKTYLDNGTLPSQDEDKFISVQFWVIDYLLRHKNQDYTYLIDKNKQYEQLDDIIEDDDDYATDEPPAWHKWAKWAVAMVVIFGIKTCVSDWRTSKPKPAPVAEPTVSGSLKPQTTPTAAPATTAHSQTAENIGNNAVSVSDAVFVLQQKLPKTAFTGQHEIETVHYFDNQYVTVKIKDKSRGRMSIRAANGLYCREPLFDGLRAANAVVIFDVQTQDDLRYEISVYCQ